MSIVHEGPGMPFVTKTMFEYISGNEISHLSVCPLDIPHHDIATIAKEVKCSLHILGPYVCLFVPFEYSFKKTMMQSLLMS